MKVQKYVNFSPLIFQKYCVYNKMDKPYVCSEKSQRYEKNFQKIAFFIKGHLHFPKYSIEECRFTIRATTKGYRKLLKITMERYRFV